MKQWLTISSDNVILAAMLILRIIGIVIIIIEDIHGSKSNRNSKSSVI